jgi:drug/metabolite transporter (DMT)-like permease
MTAMADEGGIAVQSTLKGVGLVTLATLLFALADVITKHLTMLYAVPLVVLLRYLVNLALLTAVLAPRHGRALFRIRRTGLVLVRALSLSVASLSLGLALRHMPLGETVAITYLAPVAVMIAAIPLLGERAGLVGWLAAAAGFLGVLLIVRPGAGLDAWGVVFALVTAAASATYHLLSRVLARTETTIALLFHTALAGAVVFGLLTAVVWDGLWPSLPDLGLTLALGVLATLGHALFTAAYREAPASLLAPVNYLHLVWAGILGWLFFAHAPDGLTLSGMALVTAAGVAVALRTRFSRG